MESCSTCFIAGQILELDRFTFLQIRPMQWFERPKTFLLFCKMWRVSGGSWDLNIWNPASHVLPSRIFTSPMVRNGWRRDNRHFSSYFGVCRCDSRASKKYKEVTFIRRSIQPRYHLSSLAHPLSWTLATTLRQRLSFWWSLDFIISMKFDRNIFFTIQTRAAFREIW